MSVNKTEQSKGLGILFGDRLRFTTNSQDLGYSIQWKQLEPF
jgi:hypothetical protein